MTNRTFICACCDRPRTDARWHPLPLCFFRAWRDWRRTGIDPVQRAILRNVPPSKITYFPHPSPDDGYPRDRKI